MKKAANTISSTRPVWVAWCDWVLRWGSALIIFLVPILWFSSRVAPAITSKVYFFQGASILLCIPFVWVWFADSRYRISKQGLWFIGILFVLLCSLTVSSLVGSDPLTSFFGTVERGTGMIFLWSAFLYSLIIASVIGVHKEQFLKTLFVANLVASSVVAISTYFSPGGLLGNSSYVGAYFVFSLFFGIVLLVKESRSWIRILYGAMIVLIVTSPVLTAVWNIGNIFHDPLSLIGSSRMAFLSLVIGLIVTACLVVTLGKFKKPLRIFGTMMLCLFVGGGAYLGVSMLNPQSSLHAQFVEQATGTRFIFWDIAKKGVRERPAFGWGPENYRDVYASYFDPLMLEQDFNREGWIDKPHNATLEMFVSGGVIGGVLSCVFLISVLGMLGFLYRRGVFGVKETSLFVGLWIAYVLQNQLFFDGIVSYMLVFLFVGILAGFAKTDSGGVRQVSLARSGVLISTLVTIVVLAAWYVFAVVPSVQIKHVSRAVFATDKSLVVYQEKDDSFIRAASSYPLRSSSDFFSYVVFSYYNENLEAATSDIDLRHYAKEHVSDVLGLIDALPGRVERTYRLAYTGSALGNIGMIIADDFSSESLIKAESYGRKALALSPTDPQAYLNLAETLLYGRRADEARELIDKAINLNPRLPEPYRFKVRLERFFGTPASLRAAQEEAQIHFPDLIIE